MEERELVQRLAVKAERLAAVRALIGGVTSTELRHVRPSDAVLQALTEGLADADPKVRWWCVQLLDHVPDRRAIDAITTVLRDPVPRVRRNAAHALGCAGCKPDWAGDLSPAVLEILHDLASNDRNGKVRAEAGRALACRSGG